MPQAQPQQARSRDPMDDAFELFFGVGSGPVRPVGMHADLGWRPATDVYETADEFVIQMDLAGMRRRDIHVLIEEGFLVVKGVRSNIAPPGKKHFHKMEIQIGPFQRHIRIPEHVDPSSAGATYDAGFLFIRLRKGTARPVPRRTIHIEEA
jgi:HSP20 family protein